MSAEPADAYLLLRESELAAPDSVLETNVQHLLTDFLQAGGKVATAIQHMSDGYMGYAHMAELMVEWAGLADMPMSSLATGSGLGSSGGSLHRAYGAAGSGGSRPLLQSSGSLSAAAASAGTAGDGASLDVLLLQELVKEHFDPTRFLQMFKHGHPEWLDQLIRQATCRKMIYELSAVYKNSLLLNYAIQRILKQGYEDEVAQVGGSLASYFDVHHRLLASRLSAATRATDTKQMRSIAGDIVESSVGNQHTYVHAQQLLTALAQLPKGAVFRRLSQEVEAAAAERQGGIKVYQLQPLFVPQAASPLECQAVQLVAEVLAKSAPNLPGTGAEGPSQDGNEGAQLPFKPEQLSAAEAPLAALQRLYQQELQLSVQPLRHPCMLQLLLSGMYVASDAKPSPMSQQTCSMRELCIRLLALAVAGRAQQGQQQQQSEQANGQQQLEQASGEQPQQPQQQDVPQQRRSLSPEVTVPGGVDSVAERLRQALALSNAIGAGKLQPKHLDKATEVCRLPVAALGVLQHCQAALSSSALYLEEKVSVVVPNHLSVLHRVACEQPGLIPQVLGVLRSVLKSLGPSQHELVKSVLAFLVSIMVSGAVLPVLELVLDWGRSADPSLKRHFLQLVLESVGPPFSEPFARAMLQLLDGCLNQRLKASHAELLREFALGCRDIPFRPPLSKALEAIVDELGS